MHYFTVKKRPLMLAAVLAAALPLLANGDPVVMRSALFLSRNPVAVRVPEVKLLDERCTVALHDGYADVGVRYLLHNHSSRDLRQLPYGFPIDWQGSGTAHWEFSSSMGESIWERGWRESYVRDVMFSLDGRSLPWQCSRDTVLRKPEPYVDYFTVTQTLGENGDPLLTPDSLDTYYSAGRERKLVAKYGDSILSYTTQHNRRWYYTLLDLPAGRVVELKVRYRVETFTQRSLYGEEGEFSAFRGVLDLYCDFSYDFSPAAYWGDGRAQRFQVVVDTSDVTVSRGSRDEGDFLVEGLPLQRKGRMLCHEARDLDFATAEPLSIVYHARRPHEEVTELLSRRIRPDRYTISVSGSDPRYPVANLSDLDLGTATVLRPDKLDSTYITITFRDSVVLNGILLYNGYCKDRQTWLNNSRIKRLKYRCPVIVSEWNEVVTPEDFSWQGLTDAAAKLRVTERQQDFGDWKWPQRQQKVKSVTLRVADIVAGAKYNDLCVSEIILIEEK